MQNDFNQKNVICSKNAERLQPEIASSVVHAEEIRNTETDCVEILSRAAFGVGL